MNHTKQISAIKSASVLTISREKIRCSNFLSTAKYLLLTSPRSTPNLKNSYQPTLPEESPYAFPVPTMSEAAVYNEVMRAAYYALRAAKKAGADEEELQELLADGKCSSFRLRIRPRPLQQSHVSN
jgi:hypothetical protein